MLRSRQGGGTPKGKDRRTTFRTRRTVPGRSFYATRRSAMSRTSARSTVRSGRSTCPMRLSRDQISLSPRSRETHRHIRSARRRRAPSVAQVRMDFARCRQRCCPRLQAVGGWRPASSQVRVGQSRSLFSLVVDRSWWAGLRLPQAVRARICSNEFVTTATSRFRRAPVRLLSPHRSMCCSTPADRSAVRKEPSPAAHISRRSPRGIRAALPPFDCVSRPRGTWGTAAGRFADLCSRRMIVLPPRT
jgi:hypothetical protein